MKFGKLVEYNTRNIFREKSYVKYGGKTIPRPFSKKWKLSISLDQQTEVLYSLFLLYAKLRSIEIYWNWAENHLLLLDIKLFKKQNKVWN